MGLKPVVKNDVKPVVKNDGSVSWKQGDEWFHFGLTDLVSAKEDVNIHGVSLIFNKILGDIKGFSVGVFNQAHTSTGLHVNVLNVADHDQNGVHVGAVNFAVCNQNGVSVGLGNAAERDQNGVFVGLSNLADNDQNGVFVSLLNVANGNVNGFELGIANITRGEVEGGSLGLVNIWRSGQCFGILTDLFCIPAPFSNRDVAKAQKIFDLYVEGAYGLGSEEDYKELIGDGYIKDEKEYWFWVEIFGRGKKGILTEDDVAALKLNGYSMFLIWELEKLCGYKEENGVGTRGLEKRLEWLQNNSVDEWYRRDYDDDLKAEMKREIAEVTG